MDKETLSHYGWIVIVIIIIAALIIAATPFASLVKAGINDNAKNFASSANNMYNNVLSGGNGDIGNGSGNGSGSGSGSGSDIGNGSGSGSDSGDSGDSGNINLSAPILTITDDILEITPAPGDIVDSYVIFVNGEEQVEIAAGSPTQYNLAELGLYPGYPSVSVISKADNCVDSEASIIAYEVPLPAPDITFLRTDVSLYYICFDAGYISRDGNDRAYQCNEETERFEWFIDGVSFGYVEFDPSSSHVYDNSIAISKSTEKSLLEAIENATSIEAVAQGTGYPDSPKASMSADMLKRIKESSGSLLNVILPGIGGGIW